MVRMGACYCRYNISDEIPFYHMGLFLFLPSCVSATALSHLPETSGQRLGASAHQDKIVQKTKDTDTRTLNLEQAKASFAFKRVGE